MRVLFINPYFKPYFGGIERVIVELAKELKVLEPNIEIGLLTTRWAFPSEPREKRVYHHQLPAQEVIDDIHVYRISSFPRWAIPLYQVPLVWYPIAEIKHVISSFRPDIIQLMNDKWFWGNFWSTIFRGDAKVHYSYSYHDLTKGSSDNWLLWSIKQFLKPINQYISHKAAGIAVITEHEKRCIERSYHVPAEKISVIPWGKSFKIVNPPVRSNSAVVILCVGRLSQHKGQLFLAKQYSKLETKPKTQLVFIGAVNKAIAAELANIRQQLPPEKDIQVIGEVGEKELEAWYRKADIFALFPEYEAFGLVFIEAMSFGIPVITHKVGALAEVLNEGAVLLEPYHEEQIRDAMVELIDKADYRVKLGKQGFDFVNERFSWENTASEFLKLYKL